MYLHWRGNSHNIYNMHIRFVFYSFSFNIFLPYFLFYRPPPRGTTAATPGDFRVSETTLSLWQRITHIPRDRWKQNLCTRNNFEVEIRCNSEISLLNSEMSAINFLIVGNFSLFRSEHSLLKQYPVLIFFSMWEHFKTILWRRHMTSNIILWHLEAVPSGSRCFARCSFPSISMEYWDIVSLVYIKMRTVHFFSFKSRKKKKNWKGCLKRRMST